MECLEGKSAAVHGIKVVYQGHRNGVKALVFVYSWSYNSYLFPRLLEYTFTRSAPWNLTLKFKITGLVERLIGV